MRGGGFLDVINDIGHKTGEAFSLGNNIPFNPYDLGYQLGHDVIAPALMKGYINYFKYIIYIYYDFSTTTSILF